MRRMKTVLAFAAVAALAGQAYGADLDPQRAAEAVQTKVYKLLDKDITTVKFAPNSADLSDAEKSSLRSLVNAVRDDARVDRLIVAAWADKEYPGAKGENLPKADRDLADRRKDNLSRFLKDLGVKDVDTFSFAEHPGWLSRVFNTEEAKIKGAGKTRDLDDRTVAEIGKRLRDKGGPGTSVVVVKHKDDMTAH